MAIKLLAFAGSSKKGSQNQKLLDVAIAAARTAGAEVTAVNLADYPMPIFSEDLEAEGVPESVSSLKKLAIEHDGYLIASPEYNGSISPLLKNTIDWLSRKHGDEAHMAAYNGKIAAVMAASPGGLGGIRALPHLRYILEGIGVMVVPETIALGSSYQAFDDNGNLKDEGMQQRVVAMAKRLMEVTSSKP